MMTIVVDTHTLLWYLADDSRLGVKAQEALSQRSDVSIVIPIIVLFEIAYLQNRKQLPISLDEVRVWIAGNRHVRVYPLDMPVLGAAPRHLEIHDAMIAGTALALVRSGMKEVVVATCDQALLEFSQIKCVW